MTSRVWEQVTCLQNGSRQRSAFRHFIQYVISLWMESLHSGVLWVWFISKHHLRTQVPPWFCPPFSHSGVLFGFDGLAPELKTSNLSLFIIVSLHSWPLAFSFSNSTDHGVCQMAINPVKDGPHAPLLDPSEYLWTLSQSDAISLLCLFVR